MFNKGLSQLLINCTNNIYIENKRSLAISFERETQGYYPQVLRTVGNKAKQQKKNIYAPQNGVGGLLQVLNHNSCCSVIWDIHVVAITQQTHRCPENKTNSRILSLIGFKERANFYLAIDTYLGVLCLQLHCWVIIASDSHFLGARGKEVESTSTLHIILPALLREMSMADLGEGPGDPLILSKNKSKKSQKEEKLAGQAKQRYGSTTGC